MACHLKIIAFGRHISSSNNPRSQVSGWRRESYRRSLTQSACVANIGILGIATPVWLRAARYQMHRETIDSAACHTTTRATTPSPLYCMKYVRLTTPFARQSRSTSVAGCNPSFDRLTRSNVVCDGGVEGNAKFPLCTCNCEGGRTVLTQSYSYIIAHVMVTVGP